jgi:hypothetical protein
MKIQFMTSVAVIAPEPSVSRKLYIEALGLPLAREGDGYLHSEDIEGCKSFGVWPLTHHRRRPRTGLGRGAPDVPTGFSPWPRRGSRWPTPGSPSHRHGRRDPARPSPRAAHRVTCVVIGIPFVPERRRWWGVVRDAAFVRTAGRSPRRNCMSFTPSFRLAPALALAGTSPCKRANRKLDSVPEHRADACQAITRERRARLPILRGSVGERLPAHPQRIYRNQLYILRPRKATARLQKPKLRFNPSSGEWSVRRMILT